MLEFGESLKVLQSGVRDLGAVEVQRLELGKPLEALDVGVRDLGVSEGYAYDRLAAAFFVTLHHGAQLRDLGDRFVFLNLPLGPATAECSADQQYARQQG